MAASDPDAARCRIATQFLESELDYWLSLQNAFKHYYKPLLARVPDVLGRLLYACVHVCISVGSQALNNLLAPYVPYVGVNICFVYVCMHCFVSLL